MDFKLDPITHDLVIDSAGRVETVDDVDESQQRCKIVLKGQQGEWDFDLSWGVPWIQAMRERPVDLGALRGAIVQQLLNVPGVDEVVSLNLAADPLTRELTVSGSVRASGVVLEI